MIKSYKQTTYESCLAVCLMQLIGLELGPKQELEIWKKGWTFSFIVNQLNYVAKKDKIELKVIVENDHFCNRLKKIANSNVTLKSEAVDLKLLRNLLKTSPVITYVDNFYLQKTVRSPHFILVTKYHNGKYTVVDSWDGKIKLVAPVILRQSTESLRRNMFYSPVLIYK